MNITYHDTNLLFRVRWLRHLVFWLLIYTAFLFIRILDSPNVLESVLGTLIWIPFQIMAAYLLMYYQIPKLALKGKYIAFVVSILVTGYLLTVASRITTVYVLEPMVITKPFVQESILEILTSLPHLFFIYFIRVYIGPFFFVIAKLVKDRHLEMREREALEKEKVEAELNFLKAQIHPHFLFNTLNNLYALTLRKSDQAPEMVLKLSAMMDYMLYQCKQPTVAIAKEIALVKDYIDLEQLRYGDRLDLKFGTEVENDGAPISPLVLLTLVENAFKHGASGTIEQPVIHIDLKQKGSELNFTVFNSKPAALQNDPSEYRKGIGSSNIRRQLEISYPDHHRIEVEEKEKSYQVSLYIDLTKHRP